MKTPQFTLWSALVALTACQLIFSAASGSLLAFFLYIVVIIASVKVVRYDTLHPWIRFVLLSAITTPPLLLMLNRKFWCRETTVVEKSLMLNLLVVLPFWISIFLWDALNPGTAPGRSQRIVAGLLVISLIGVIHGAIQLAAAWGFRKLVVGLKT